MASLRRKLARDQAELAHQEPSPPKKVHRTRSRNASAPLRPEIERKIRKFEPIVLEDEELRARRQRAPRELPAFMDALVKAIGSTSHQARMGELRQRLWLDSGKDSARRESRSTQMKQA
jgi:hypothetical protein